MVKQSKITCPECRQEATVPSEGIGKQFRLIDELKHKVESEEEVKCENCDEDYPVVVLSRLQCVSLSPL